MHARLRFGNFALRLFRLVGGASHRPLVKTVGTCLAKNNVGCACSDTLTVAHELDRTPHGITEGGAREKEEGGHTSGWQGRVDYKCALGAHHHRTQSKNDGSELSKDVDASATRAMPCDRITRSSLRVQRIAVRKVNWCRIGPFYYRRLR